jgi:hypothetical protein
LRAGASTYVFGLRLFENDGTCSGPRELDHMQIEARLRSGWFGCKADELLLVEAVPGRLQQFLPSNLTPTQMLNDGHREFRV